MIDAPLRRGQAPFLLPTRVEVNGEPNPKALAALAKRILYPPAKWKDELDDRTSARGLLAVTFAGELPGGGHAVLYLRAKAGREPPVCAIHGPLHPLGHNAGKRGWQPFVLPLVTAEGSEVEPLGLVPDLTINTNINAPLSRMLLGRL